MSNTTMSMKGLFIAGLLMSGQLAAQDLEAVTDWNNRVAVSTVASGNSSSRKRCTAASASNAAPPLATITGSTTSTGGRQCRRRSATAATTSVPPSMPSLTASTRMSANTASICAATKAGGNGSMALTPQVFCAVRPLNAAMP
jgi:hypothetical protein